MCRFVRSAFFTITLSVLAIGTAHGQSYPNKPIRIVTAGLGGGNDLAARLIASGLSSSFGQPVVVDNRGNQPSIPVSILTNAPSDGYTLLAYGPPLWIVPLLETMPYDPVRDLAPITIASTSPNILVVNPALPIKSVSELIAYAKSKPGELNYGDPATGGAPHLGAELLKIMAGVSIVRIPFKDNATLATDLLANRIQIAFGNAATVAPLMKSGRLRGLAVTSAKPSALFPDLPTVASSGLPGFELVATTPLFARAKTPAAVITRLNQEMIRVLNQPQVKEKLFSIGVEVVGSSPEELLTYMKADIARMAKVIKTAGIRVE